MSDHDDPQRDAVEPAEPAAQPDLTDAQPAAPAAGDAETAAAAEVGDVNSVTESDEVTEISESTEIVEPTVDGSATDGSAAPDFAGAPTTAVPVQRSASPQDPTQVVQSQAASESQARQEHAQPRQPQQPQQPQAEQQPGFAQEPQSQQQPGFAQTQQPQQPAQSPSPSQPQSGYPGSDASVPYLGAAYPAAAQPGAPNQPNQPPTPSGPYPAYQGQLPPQYPQQQPPYQGMYPNPAQAAPARPAGPPPVTGVDVLGSLFDGGRALFAGFASALIALLVIVYAGFPNANASFGELVKGSVYLLGSSLGTPLTGNATVSAGGDGFGSSETASVGLTLRLTVWALTFIVLFLLFAFARKRERQAASRSLGQLILRSALTALVVSLILLILALVTRSDAVLGSALASSGLSGLSGSAGLGAGYVFLGPLLLALAAGLLGRFGIWLHAPTTADPRAERAKAAVARWRPAARVAWRQMAVMGTLIAIGLWVWLAVDAFQDPSTGPYRTGLILGALVLLPNLAVYGTFAGMGVTLFAGGAYGASMLGQSTGDSVDGSPTSSSSGLGLLQGEHPWGLWLLLLGVIVGTLAPAVLARTTRRFAVNRDDYALNGAWRSVVVGLGTALVVVLLGALSLDMSGSAGGLGSMSATISLGPSLLGALGLTALWFLLAYLAVSLSQGHRFQPATPRQPAGIPPQGTPEYAQYMQYQQYLQQQQAYQQQMQQQPPQQTQQPQPQPQNPYTQQQPPAPVQPVPAQPGPDQTAGPTVTVPLAQQSPVTQVTQALGSEPLPSAGPEPTLEQSQPSATVPQQQPFSAEEPTQFVANQFAAGPGSSGAHDTAPPAPPTEPFQPNYGQFAQPEAVQQYAEQYPQQYAQPYPQQQYPAQWAPPGQPGQPGQPGPWLQPGQPQPGQPGARKGLRGRAKIVVPLVLVVLAGGGFLTYHLLSGGSQGGAVGAVTTYFNDLAAGDAKDAAALAESPADSVPVISSSATLADAADRPTGFTVVTSRKATATEQADLTKGKFTGTNPTVVVVKYTVRGKQVTDTYIALQNAQGKWLLPSPYLYVSVTGGWSDKATVDGTSFTAQTGALVFPGAHVIAEPSNPDFSSESTTIVPTTYTSDGDSWAVYGSNNDGEITLPAPTLSSTGQSAVQKAYSSALDDCATQADTGSGDCGIDNYYDYYLCNNVTWTVTTVGTVTVDLSSQDSDGSFSWSSNGTVASESGDYTDYSGADQTFQNQSTDLQNDGSVVFNSDGSATVTITD